MTPNLPEIQTEAKITQKWSHLKTDQRQTDGQTDRLLSFLQVK